MIGKWKRVVIDDGIKIFVFIQNLNCVLDMSYINTVPRK